MLCAYFINTKMPIMPKKTILDEVRQARRSVLEEFGGDLHKFFVWAGEHTSAESEAGCRLPFGSASKTVIKKTVVRKNAIHRKDKEVAASKI